jgi:hypothetical protein
MVGEHRLAFMLPRRSAGITDASGAINVEDVAHRPQVSLATASL